MNSPINVLSSAEIKHRQARQNADRYGVLAQPHERYRHLSPLLPGDAQRAGILLSNADLKVHPSFTPKPKRQRERRRQVAE